MISEINENIEIIVLIIQVILVVFAIFAISINIFSVGIRLGRALWKRKIAIVGNLEAFTSLKNLLLGSQLFKEKNIRHIEQGNQSDLRNQTVILIDWESFWGKTNPERILDFRNNSQTGILIYAKPNTIPPQVLQSLCNQNSIIIVNFKGRLLNDIMLTMITTTYS